MGVLIAGVLGLLMTAVAARADPEPLSLDGLAQRAQAQAKQPYQESSSELPQALSGLSYDQYRNIRFNPDKALWRDQSLFEAQFFPPGFIYRHRTRINTLDDQVTPAVFPYDASNFILGEAVSKLNLNLAQLPAPGYAGFRIHYPINSSEYKDEVAVFQGASYFRLVGPGQVYGLSARGLAVDTAVSSGEEFPRFTEFWLQKPNPGASSMTFYAYLDSASVTGAYRFELSTGIHTKVKVDARLFARQNINKLGLAPLTSMFFVGENSVIKPDDYRPEVHDSDGLLLETGQGEWIWRPLNNPKALSVVSFQGPTPRGFGLMQRDRDFEHYLDVEAHYHQRPGLWVQPQGDWGPGRVELVEIPTASETNDNIVAYWVPDKNFNQGDSMAFSYTLQTFNRGPVTPDLASVVRSRNGWAHAPGQKPPPRARRQFVVDFDGPALANLSPQQSVKADLSVSSGKLSDIDVKRLPNSKQWRASFKLETVENKTADMRLFLTLQGHRISEVWSYVWNPGDISQ